MVASQGPGNAAVVGRQVIESHSEPSLSSTTDHNRQPRPVSQQQLLGALSSPSPDAYSPSFAVAEAARTTPLAAMAAPARPQPGSAISVGAPPSTASSAEAPTSTVLNPYSSPPPHPSSPLSSANLANPAAAGTPPAQMRLRQPLAPFSPTTPPQLLPSRVDQQPQLSSRPSPQTAGTRTPGLLGGGSSPSLTKGGGGTGQHCQLDVPQQRAPSPASAYPRLSPSHQHPPCQPMQPGQAASVRATPWRTSPVGLVAPPASGGILAAAGAQQTGGEPTTPLSPTQEATLLLQQAETQRQELWGLLDRLVAGKEGRAREAERLLWDARYELRKLERRALDAEEQAGRSGDVVHSAQQAAEQAQRAQQQLHAQLDATAQRASQLAASLEEATSQLEAAKDEIEHEKQQWEAREGDMLAELEQLRAQAGEHEAQQAALCAELDDEAQRAQQAERERDSMAALLGQRDAEVAARERQLAENEEGHHRQVASYQEQVEELTSQNQQLLAAAQQAQRDEAAAQGQAEAAARQRALVEDRCQLAERERDHVLDQLRGADEDLQRLSQELSDAAAAHGQAHAELLAARGALEQEQRAGREAAARLREQGVQLAAAQALVRDRGAELEARELEIRQLQVTLEDASHRVESAQQELSTARLTLRMLQSEKAGLQEDLQVHAAELSSLRATHAELDVRVRCMEGDPAACRTRTLAELERLVGVVETAAPRLRDVVTERRIEAARNEVAAASQLTCIVCCANQRDTFLNCGHLICRACAERLSCCPVCRVAITSRTRAFV